MAVAWKKVVTTSDIIPVAQGGTGVNTLSDGGVLIGNADGNVQAVDMGDNAILIGVGGGADPVARTAHATSDVVITDDGTTYGATIQAGVVTGGSGGMLAEDTTVWTHNEATISGNKLKIPFYNGATGAADLIAAPATNGNVLAYNDSGTGSLEWVSAGSATTLTVTDKTDTNNTAFKIGFTDVAAGSGTSFMVSDDMTFNTDTGNDNTTALLSLKGGTVGGATGIAIAASDTEGSSTITADKFHGLADVAKKLNPTTVATAAATYQIPVIDNSNTTANSVSGRDVNSHSTFTYTTDAQGVGTLNVANLNVTGTTTTINTTNLEVEDHSIRLSVPDVASSESLTDSSAVTSNEVGIIVGFNTEDDGNLPRLVYKGMTDASSVIGWRIARSGGDINASSASDSFGVGVMVKTVGDLSATGGTNQNAAGDGPLDVAVGAMAIDNSGDLWIQTGTA